MIWQNTYRKPGADPFPPMTLLFAFASKWLSEKTGKPIGQKVSEQANAFKVYQSIAQMLN